MSGGVRLRTPVVVEMVLNRYYSRRAVADHHHEQRRASRLSWTFLATLHGVAMQTAGAGFAVVASAASSYVRAYRPFLPAHVMPWRIRCRLASRFKIHGQLLSARSGLLSDRSRSSLAPSWCPRAWVTSFSASRKLDHRNTS